MTFTGPDPISLIADAVTIFGIPVLVDHLTQSGWLDPARLYETPFIDFNARGVEGLFDAEQVNQMIAILEEVRHTAEIQ